MSWTRAVAPLSLSCCKIPHLQDRVCNFLPCAGMGLPGKHSSLGGGQALALGVQGLCKGQRQHISCSQQALRGGWTQIQLGQWLWEGNCSEQGSWAALCPEEEKTMPYPCSSGQLGIISLANTSPEVQKAPICVLRCCCCTAPAVLTCGAATLPSPGTAGGGFTFPAAARGICPPAALPQVQVMLCR